MYSLNLLNFVFVVVFDVFRRRGVVAITAAQLHSTKPELGFRAGSNPARGVFRFAMLRISDKQFGLEIRLNACRRSTKPEKQFIINSFKQHQKMPNSRFQINKKCKLFSSTCPKGAYQKMLFRKVFQYFTKTKMSSSIYCRTHEC